jgi:hypothetical protein
MEEGNRHNHDRSAYLYGCSHPRRLDELFR